MRLWNLEEEGRFEEIPTSPNQVVFSASFSPDGAFLASGSSDGLLRLTRVAP